MPDYRALIESLPQLIWACDEAGRATYLSPQWLSYTGAREADQLGRGWLEWVHEEDRERVRAEWQRASGSGTPLEISFRILNADGSYRWFKTRASPNRDRAGKVDGWSGTCTDIDELQRSNFALDGTGDGVWDYDVATGSVFLSDRSCDLLGYPRGARPNREARLATIHADDRERAARAMLQHIRGATPMFSVEYRVCRPDGSYLWVLARGQATAHGPDGNALRVVGTYKDISERRRVQEALEHREEDLRRSNEELQQFAYVASHDLQEPLRAVAGCTQLFANRFKGKLDPEADVLIGHIVDGSARMKALIEGLLTLSRLKTGERPTSKVETSLVVAQALKNLESRIASEGAELDVDPLPQVRGDAIELMQLLQNLIGNALKYRSQAPPRIHVSARKTREGHDFSVQDNGIGIDPQYFERIFGLFQRLHTREEYPGTGIGLAICRKIITHHGGRIWVESTPGVGTTFHFTIPD